MDVGQSPDVTWVVLADPEGNEFFSPIARYWLLRAMLNTSSIAVQGAGQAQTRDTAASSALPAQQSTPPIRAMTTDADGAERANSGAMYQACGYASMLNSAAQCAHPASRNASATRAQDDRRWRQAQIPPQSRARAVTAVFRSKPPRARRSLRAILGA